MRRNWAGWVLGAAIAASVFLPMTRATAQEPGEQAGAGRGGFAGMQRVQGEVTAVSGDKITVKAIDGATTQVVTTSNTRMMKAGGAPLKISEIKAGDGVMAAGNLDAPNKTLHAAILFWTDGAQLRKMREDLGKTYIAGKVTAIDLDNAKMTVQRPDGVSQTIGFDESTSFRRGRIGRGGMGVSGAGSGATNAGAPAGESITLADIQVGDNVAGAGSLKSGVFVPTLLTVAAPHQHHEGGPPGGPGAPPATAPK